MKKLLLAFVLVLALAAPGWAATYYLRTDGSDANDGSVNDAAHAWLTLEYALEGSHMAVGDTLRVTVGTYDAYTAGTDNRIITVLGAGTGTTTVAAYPAGAAAVINIPASTGTGYFYPPDGSAIEFQGISFTNSHAVATNFLIANADRTATFTGCSIDHGNVVGYLFQLNNTSALTITRCLIKNANGASGVRVDNTTGTVTVTVSACVIHDVNGFIDNKKGDIYLYNNTFDNPITSPFAYLNTAAGTFTAKNNIFITKAFPNCSVAIQAANACAADIIATPAHFVVKNNAFYNFDTLTHTEFDWIIDGTDYLLPVDKSNHFINPNFTNRGTNTYTITAASPNYMCGRGDATVLPAGGDYAGTAWTGADIGAYANPRAAEDRPALQPKVAFVGDSIMGGSNGTAGNKEYEVYQTLTGRTTLGGATAGFASSGMGVQGARWLVDYAILYGTGGPPRLVFFSAGVNTLNNAAASVPSGATSAQVATEIVSCLQKIQNWGAIPVWLGVESLVDDQAKPEAVNALVNASWSGRKGSILAEMKRLHAADWATTYYTDLAADVHPNNAGHALIADLAEQLWINLIPIFTVLDN